MNNSSRVHVKLVIDGAEIEGAVELPAAPGENPPRRLLLPVLQNLTNAIVTLAEQRVLENGAPVTCAKGCDACCRQMVPVSPTEAYGLAHLLTQLSAAHAKRIGKRFAENAAALHRAGLLDKLRNRHRLSQGELAKLDRDYFAQQLPCPFLEDHACSIHPQRPLACREFLVTSDPRHCTDPGSGKINQVQLGAKLSRALLGTEAWLPLTLALEHAETTPEQPAALTPAEDLTNLLNSLR
ncbi:MAG: YkgJ family cysteine cluster protein [Phycisphaerae bacterium]